MLTLHMHDISSWTRNEVNDDGVDVRQEMENEKVEDELINVHDRDDIFEMWQRFLFSF